MKPEKAEAKRAQILDAAAEVFGDKGFHATNIADIAQKLGMGHGTFYRYFDNKLDIFKHVVDRAVERVAETVAKDAPSEANDLSTYRKQVVRIGERLTELFLDEEHVAKLLFVEAPGIDPEVTARLDAAFDAFADLTEVYLHNGCNKGFLRADLDTKTTARAIDAMIFECVRRATKESDPKKTARAWLKTVVALMFEGIGA